MSEVSEVVTPVQQPISQPTATPQPATASLSDFGIDTSSADVARQENEDGTFVTGIGDESVKNYDFEFYKGRKNNTDRLSILKPEHIYGARVHYVKDLGYIVCHSKWKQESGAEVNVQPADCCTKLGDPSKRFAALVLHYNTKPDGNPISPLGFQMKLWKFTPDKFTTLRTVNKNFPLAKHDILIMCQEEQFQKLSMQPIPEEKSLIGKSKFWEVYGKVINPWINSSLPKMAKAVGRKLSLQELREKLGLAVAPVVEQATLPVADISDLIA